MLLRLVIYGLVGFCSEVIWTALYDAVIGTRTEPDSPSVRVKLSSQERWRLMGRTYLWMLPIYGSAVLAFEPAHDAQIGRAHV